MIFKSKDSDKHKRKLKTRWKSILNIPIFGKIIAIITIIISILWLILGWPYNLIKGYKRIKN